jgi:UDP-2,3-diacylglucosamine pyrophosphatase LpxH
MAERAMLNLTSYQRNINKGLDKSLREALILPLDIRTARLMIFSDQHKGRGDEADDFRLSEPSYLAALEYYLELGHTLVVLGDVEELWENPPSPVLEFYSSILKKENEYHHQNRYWRFWGNHDDEWRHPAQVRKYLGKFFPDIVVYESVRLDFYDVEIKLGEILLVHGHQGTLAGDRFGWLTRLLIRYIWRPIQRLFNIQPNTPATDWRLRCKHDIAMYNWASDKERLVLIAGHTHHPIFPASSRLARLTEDYRSVKDLSVDPEEVLQAQVDLEYARAEEKPSYFNAGCCCFNDGRITGIEIVDGEIRLIRWPDDIGQQVPQILESADLRDVFYQVASRAAPMRFPEELQ